MKQTRCLMIFAWVLLGLIGTLPAQEKGADTIRQTPFESGEELVFVGEYTLFLVRGVHVADLRMTILSRPDDAATAAAGNDRATFKWRISAEAESRGALSKLFGLSFHYAVESTVDPSSFSVLRTERRTEQGGRQVASESVFNPATGEAVWAERDLKKPDCPPKTVDFTFTGGPQDIASAFYFARTLELTPGRSFEIPVSDWGTVYHVPLKVVEREKLETARGKVTAVRLEAGVFGKGRLLGREGELTVWVTDDARHIPVGARLDFGVGRIDIKLKGVTGGLTDEARRPGAEGSRR